jgi:hypothetical protein
VWHKLEGATAAGDAPTIYIQKLTGEISMRVGTLLGGSVFDWKILAYKCAGVNVFDMVLSSTRRLVIPERFYHGD